MLKPQLIVREFPWSVWIETWCDLAKLLHSPINHLLAINCCSGGERWSLAPDIMQSESQTLEQNAICA